MRQHIRHIPLLAALMYATSCTSDPDPGIVPPTTGEEMIFEAESEPLARAVVTTSETLTNKPFKLFGDVNRTGEYYPGLKEMFGGTKVTFKNNRWDYGAKQYWLMGQEHSFVAIHPYDIPEITDISYSNSTLSFKYSLPQDLNAANDLLIATHRRKYTLDSAKPVKFNFIHILPRINVAPALDEVLMYEDETDRENYPYNKDEYILIRSLEIRSFKATGSFTLTPDPLAGSMTNDKFTLGYAVETEEKLVSIKFEFEDKPIKVTNNNETVYVIDKEAPIVMIPQTFKTPLAEIVLEYTVNDDEPRRKIIIPLNGKTWEMGKMYTYKFTIEKAYTGQIKPGTFTIDVDDPLLTDDEHDDAWVWNGETIDFTFDKENYKDDYKQ